MKLCAYQLERFYAWSALLLFFLFSACVINHAFFFTMDADEAYNATTAKNWLLGYGYSSSIGVIFPFDPYISSGPAYTFLVAIPIAIFGNNPDAIKPFMALLHIVLLGSSLIMLKSLSRQNKNLFWQLLFMVAFFCLVEFKFWHRSAGELLSVLYFINAILLIDFAFREKKFLAIFLGGVLASSAVLTKSQAWFFVVGLLLAMAVANFYLLHHGKLSRIIAVRLWLSFLLAFLLPLLAWKVYENSCLKELSVVDPDLYEYYLGKNWHFFSTHGSGVNLFWEIHSFEEFFKREAQLISRAFSKFSSAFSRLGDGAAVGAWGFFLAVILVVVTAFFDLLRFGRITALFFAIPLLVFTFWALLLNNSIYMHQMLPGIWLAIVAAGFILARNSSIAAAFGLSVFVVVVATAGKYGEFSCMDGSNAACVYTRENPIRVSYKKALKYLSSNSLPAPLANCGWYFAQDIEFALPDVNNIKDCMRLLDESVEFDPAGFVSINKLPENFYKLKSENDLKKLYVHKRKNLFGAYFVAPIKWKKPIEFTYIANIYMTGGSLEQKRNVMSFLEHCKDVLFKDEFYYIQHCRFEDLQDYVAEWNGLPIFTHSWEALYYHDFMRETKSKVPLAFW